MRRSRGARRPAALRLDAPFGVRIGYGVNCRADALKRYAERRQRLRRYAFAFEDEAEQQMLGADVRGIFPARFSDGKLNNPLAACRQPDLAGYRRSPCRDACLDSRTNRLGLDAELREYGGRGAVLETQQAEQQMLRT